MNRVSREKWVKEQSAAVLGAQRAFRKVHFYDVSQKPLRHAVCTNPGTGG